MGGTAQAAITRDYALNQQCVAMQAPCITVA